MMKMNDPETLPPTDPQNDTQDAPTEVYLPCVISQRDTLRVQRLASGHVEFTILRDGRMHESVIVTDEAASDLRFAFDLWLPHPDD
jgi:hypothetical protein